MSRRSSDVDPRLLTVIEEALRNTLPYIDHMRLDDAALDVAERVWEWLSEGDELP